MLWRWLLIISVSWSNGTWNRPFLLSMEKNRTVPSIHRRAAATIECDDFSDVRFASDFWASRHSLSHFRDIIEKFFEEQEQQLCTAVGVINPTNSSSSTTSFLSNEFKRQSPNSSISIVTIHQQETMKRSLDQIDPESEPTAKKAALNPPNSSTSTTTIV